MVVLDILMFLPFISTHILYNYVSLSGPLVKM